MTDDLALAAVILAAGQGTRMRSDMAKVLHRICGKSMIKHVLDATLPLSPERTILVVGHQAEAVMEEVGRDGIEFAVQPERLGTGHAVLQSEPILDHFPGTVMVLNGDTPLLKSSTLDALRGHHLKEGASATVLSALLEDATGYGRIIRDDHGGVLKIVEEKDATDREKKVREINSGIFCFKRDRLFSSLHKVGRSNAQKEYYLTDVIGILQRSGEKTAVYLCQDRREVIGINSIEQLRDAERLMKEYG